jgi:hypothetical protein
MEKKSNRGGARPGAGRKPGSKDHVTVKYLLEVLDQKSGGQSYEEILVDDFLSARLNNDTQLMLKYHNLISNKVLSTLTQVETVEGDDAVQAKAEAFAEALQALTKVKTK